MKVGFTGTREGMMLLQKETLQNLLKGLKPSAFHHGDCVGADAEAHNLATLEDIFTVSHPPEDDKLRAFTKADLIHTPEGYHARNKNIVHVTDLMIATPRVARGEAGGTWYTVKYAVSVSRPTFIISPDGSVRMGKL